MRVLYWLADRPVWLRGLIGAVLGGAGGVAIEYLAEWLRR